MDTDTLVENLIEDGRKLLERLPQEDFEVTAAFWLKTSDDGKWYFYIVSPVVNTEGLAKAYRRLHSVVRAMPEPFWIDPLEIKLIGTEGPVAKDAAELLRRNRIPKVSGFRWGGNRLGDLSLDDAYLYPLPVPVGD